MKILIIGFPRSGTSLTYRIFEKHLHIDKMYFETLLLWKYRKNLQNLFPSFKKNNNCGEKIIYERKHLGKDKIVEYTEYCDWWNEKFKEEAKIVQVIRHPYDQWNSIIQKKYIQRKNEKGICKMLKEYFKCVPDNIQTIDSYKNCFTFKLENLIQNPDVILRKIYKHCNLNPSKTNFNEHFRVRKSFSYKRKGFIIDQDNKVKKYSDEFWSIMNKNLPQLLTIMNKFEGPKYEV